MGRPKKADPESAADEPSGRSAREMEIDEVLASVSADEGTTLLVKRESKDTPGQMERIGTFSPQAFDVEKLRAQWGGGKYTVQVKNAKTGQYGGSKVFFLANPSGGQGGGQAGGLGGMNQDFIQALLLKLIAPPPPPQDLTPVIIALAGAFKPSSDPMETAAKFAALLKESNSGGGAVATLLQGLELGRKLESVPAADSTMLDVVKEMGPPIMSLLGKVADQGRTAPATAGNLPTTAAQQPQLAGPPSGGEMLPYHQALGNLVPRLIQWAQQDKDPELRAAVVMEDVPAWVQNIVTQESAKQNFIPDVFAAFPQLNPYSQWITEFLNAVREWCNPPADEPAAPGSVSPDGVDDE